MSGWDLRALLASSGPHPTGSQPRAELKRLCHLETFKKKGPSHT